MDDSEIYSGLDLESGCAVLFDHPDAEKILEAIRAEEGPRGFTSAFYRHFIVDLGRKELMGNLSWRRFVLEKCAGDRELQGMFREMCRRDILFWLNTFAWTYDPRNKGRAGADGLRKLPKSVPFITWSYQDDAFLLLRWCISNGVDAVVEKSRDMGASWVFLSVFDWFYLFHPQETFLMISRKDDLVDSKGDPDSLFWKLDYIHSNLPGWMVPKQFRKQGHFENAIGSTIDGESTTGDAGRGGRRTAIGLDEFAAVPPGEDQSVIDATNDATECRIFNSTPKGAGNAYHAQTKRDDIVHVRMHWSQHPHKRRGLYTCEKGKCPIHPDGGHLHSTWYDRECVRRGWNAVAIGQELDIDYNVSGSAFFNEFAMRMYEKRHARWACFRGELEYSAQDCLPGAFRENSGGTLLLWVQPSMDGSIPKSRYIVSADISEGTGASFSCATITDSISREKVGRVATPLMKPYEFARYCVALCRKFSDVGKRGAFLVWEANGPGREFGDEVDRQNYTNIYKRNRISGGARTDFNGWFSTEDNKISLFGAYRKALAEESFINREAKAIQDACKYYSNEKGVPEYRGEGYNMQKIGQSHGDIVVADALAVFAMEELGSIRQEDLDGDLMVEHVADSLGGRMESWERLQRREDGWL